MPGAVRELERLQVVPLHKGEVAKVERVGAGAGGEAVDFRLVEGVGRADGKVQQFHHLRDVGVDGDCVAPDLVVVPVRHALDHALEGVQLVVVFADKRLDLLGRRGGRGFLRRLGGVNGRDEDEGENGGGAKRCFHGVCPFGGAS